MPRPRKHRRVCSQPKCMSFGPREGGEEAVSMTIDEYEAIRLIDFEGLTQEQCAAQMQVARTTIQAIYASARKALARCIVQGCCLHIAGGDVHYCEHFASACGKGCCCKGKRCGRNGKDGMENEQTV